MHQATDFLHEPQSLSFGVFTTVVLEVTQIFALDSLQQYVKNGLYDGRMGSVSGRCETCFQMKAQCPGHYGHIELSAMKKIFLDTISGLEQGNLNALDNADYAQKILGMANRVEKFNSKKRVRNEDEEKLEYDAEDEMLIEEFMKSLNTREPKIPSVDVERTEVLYDLRNELVKNFLKGMTLSKKPTVKVIADRDASRLYLKVTDPIIKFASQTGQADLLINNMEEGASLKLKILVPAEVRKHLELLYKNEDEMCRFLFGHKVIPRPSETHKQTTRDFLPSSFFLEVLPVVPNRFRPPMFNGTMVSEHGMTRYYAKILEMSAALRSAAIGQNSEKEIKEDFKVPQDPQATKTSLMRRYIQLQMLVNYFFDSSKLPPMSSLPSGITQILEKKAGIFRKNMMGKRVNFAARTVISPDPFLQTNEIGIPLAFALTLTFPEPVTDFNVKRLMQAVVNGPNVHPGARAVEDSYGNVTRLDFKTQEQRIAIAKQLMSGVGYKIKKVHRHIKNGDPVLLNRQPTLHKPGMMGHFIRVLKTEKTMRMHYANCSTFNADFDGDEMNIHFPQDAYGKIELEEIANADNQYLVPRNGTPIRGLIQDHVVSGVLLTKRDTFFTREEFCQLVFASCLDLNMEQPIKVPTPAVIKPRALWTGKQVISAVLNQVTHNFMPINLDSKSKISEDYWGKGSWEDQVIIRENELLCGILEKNQYGASAYGLVHAVQELHGFKAAGQLLSVFSRLFTLFLQLHGFTCGIDDMLLQKQTEDERAQSLEDANKEGIAVAASVTKLDTTDKEQIKKGILQMWGNKDGRSILDGKMRQAMHEKTSQIINKCLPAGQVKKFPMNYLSLMTVSGAKGSVVNFSQISCLLGQQELEGKRVPVMPSGKTLPCFDAFEPTARAGGFVRDRFLTGLKPQEYFFHAMAGREGLIDTAVKTSRSGYLQRCLIKHLENLKVHYDNTVRDSDGSVIQFNYGEDSIDVGKSAFLQKFGFLAKNVDNLVNRYSTILTDKSGNFSGKEAAKYFKERSPKADPTLSVYNPGVYIGSVSESFYRSVNDYIQSNPDNLLRSEKNPNGFSTSKFRHLMNIKYSKSLVSPGESVGLLAAQSIGEPSTQMTLNTFHLAGRGDVNVTLGIPRLREIIMTASKIISTPTMILPLKPEFNSEQQAKDLLKDFQKVMLSDLVQEIEVQENLTREESQIVRKYVIKMKFKNTIEKEFDIKNKQLSEKLEQYLTVLSRSLVKELAKSGADKATVKAARRERAEGGGEDGDDDSPAKERDDGAEEDRKSKKKERVSYDDPDDEDKNEDKEDILENMAITEKDDEESLATLESMLSATSAKNDDIEDKDDGKKEEEEENEDVSYKSSKVSEYIEAFEINFNKKSRKNPEFTMKLKVPSTAKKVLMLSLLERTHFVVKQADKINRAITTQKKIGNADRWCIQTEGVNLGLLWKYQHKIDTKIVDCNDINAILEFYGVEAACNAIAKEISNVFNVYGISVDPRHKSLVADYMTFTGKFRAMNRISMTSKTSPLLSMSFETTMQFVKKAVLEGAVDDLKSHSARIVVGALTKGGTGSFEVMQDLSKVPIKESKSELLL